MQGWVTDWVHIEHAIERLSYPFSVLYVGLTAVISFFRADRVKAIISPNESLTPSLLYVGIATLTGSILARNRTLATRFILPPIFLVASANHFLPDTTGNLSSYLGSLEETYFPSLSEKHDVAKAHTQMTWEKVKNATASSREQLNRSAMAAVEKVQEVTGLKLRETFGWTSGKAEQDVIKVLDNAKATVENRVEKMVEEVKTRK